MEDSFSQYRTRLRRGKWFIFDSLNDQSICLVSIGANNQGIMVDSTQQIMILGTREAQILLLPDHIDFCIDRLSHITNLKVNNDINLIKKLRNICGIFRMNKHCH
jgi:hypothetical protein